MTGSEAVLRWLGRQGVPYLFGNPGTTEIPLLEGYQKTREAPRYILGLHETSCVAMADGYARVTGEPAVLSLHATPGLTNGLSMIYNAMKSHTPLIVLGGQQDQRILLEDPFLASALVDTVGPYVKARYEVSSAEQLVTALRRAWLIALTPPRGPVFVSIPMNLLRSPVPDLDIESAAPDRLESGIDIGPAMRDTIRDRLRKSRHGALLLGDGAVGAGSSEAARQLAATYRLTVYDDPFVSVLTVPWNTPGFQGRLPRTRAALLDRLLPHDFVLAVGSSLFQYFVHDESPPLPRLPLWQVDNDPLAFGKIPAERRFLAPPDAILAALAENVGDNRSPRVACPPVVAPGPRGHRPPAATDLWDVLNRVLRPEDIVVDESISYQNSLRAHLCRSEPDTYFAQTGGSLGWGIGAGVGMALARPDRRVVVITGDGSALFSLHAWWTAARLKISFLTVVLDNQGYRILREQMDAGPKDAEFFGVAAPPVDWVRLAEAMGATVSVAASRDELAALGATWPHIPAAGRPTVWIIRMGEDAP